MPQGFLTVTLLLLIHSVLGQGLFQPDKSKVGQLNTKRAAEAYPFLSSDGLRLYFTSSRDGFDRIYYSTRKSVKSKFLEASPLSQNLIDTFYEGSLTDDELTIYLHREDRLFVSSRSARNQEFSVPILLKEITGCYYAPAISPDGNELMAIRYWGCDSTLNHTSRMDHFIKNKNGIFELYHSLTIEKKFDVGPGSFTKDGLKFYMTIESKIPYSLRNQVDTCIVVKFERNHLRDRFTIFTEFYTGYLHSRLSHVTFNQDETIFIGVSTNKWEWEKTNLVYYHLKKKKKTSR